MAERENNLDRKRNVPKSLEKRSIKEKLRSAYQETYKHLKRNKLKNHDFTILCNNCCGGIIYHDLGVRFLSPTINLSFSPDDFLLFVENFYEAILSEVVEKIDSNNDYPVGIITLSSGKTIHIQFIHYDSFANAKAKWEERSSRINYNNIYILMEMGKSTSSDRIKRFSHLNFSKKLAIINCEPNEKDTVYSKIYNEEYFYGKILEYKHGVFACKRYLDDIDYVRWLNS